MIAGTYFITGTDTGVGKTVLTALLVHHLRAHGVAARAVKPFCSGGRADAQILRKAQGDELSLNEINPWHFQAALSPMLAARKEGVRVRKAQVTSYVGRIRSGCEVLLVEGAGGLLSPLGEAFNARDLIAALRATPLIVCPNRLGAINQILLVVAALPRGAERRAQVVLMTPHRADGTGASNAETLRDMLGAGRIHVLPWLEGFSSRALPRAAQRVRPELARIVSGCGLVSKLHSGSRKRTARRR